MSRKAISSAKDKLSKLPNAPLAEVVFEVRWELLGDERGGPFRIDPGYFGCLNALLENAKTIGFREHKAIGGVEQIIAPYSVGFRFYQSPGENFPVLQIGPGVFAVNESTQYTWASFKELCLKAFSLFSSCYPKMGAFPFVPIQFELRYIDALKSTASTKDLIGFLNDATHFEFRLPEFLLAPDRFGPIGDTQISFALPVKGLKETRFTIGFAKGKSSDVEALVLQSTVITKVPPNILGKTSATANAVLEKWLEDAHNITSPFFKSIIKDSLMAHYREPVND